MNTDQRGQLFSYSVVRVVPDPIKDEAVNVGVIVAPTEGVGGEMRTHLAGAVRTRLRGIQSDFDVDGIQASLDDLRVTLGIDRRIGFGETAARPMSAALLADVASRLGNQLQMTAPRRYAAESLGAATEKLFSRYVTWKAPQRRRELRLTHAALRDQILQVVSSWQSPGLHVESGRVIEGTKAHHPADVVISNGSPRAALFAVPTYQGDEGMPYLYRDRIPTVAHDMPAGMYLYAVLPSQAQLADPREREFAEETRRLLSDLPRTALIDVDGLGAIRESVERLLVYAPLGDGHGRKQARTAR